MRVLLASEIFAAPGDKIQRLPGLLDFALEARHDVMVEAAARPAWEGWLSRQDGSFAEAWRRAEQDSQGRQALNPSLIEIKVSIDLSNWEANPLSLSMNDTIDLLRQPLEILVEDETSDGLFLSRTVPPPLRATWARLLASKAVSLRTLGGVAQVPRRLEGRRSQGSHALHRSFVIIDSDMPKRWGDPADLAGDAREARKSAASHRFRIYVLLRRMAENYIPPPALRAWAGGLPRTEHRKLDHAKAFSRLPTERQHYHHLKNGLSPSEEIYYGTLTPADRTALSHPLGGKTYEAFRHAQEADLRAYGVYDELTPLFQDLIRLT
jgi:hypothetical protein